MMYQRKDKSDRIHSGCSEGVFELFRLLESSDPAEVESVKNVIHENLSTAKNSHLLNCIVDYYLALQSERSLEILVRVKDPHDKKLVKLRERNTKSEASLKKKRNSAIQLQELAAIKAKILKEHLFDKINELMKNGSTCYQSLQLLCNLVYKQPSWIYKIAEHRLMNSLFHLLKTDEHAPNLVSALLIIVCLLPMIPSQFRPFLSDTFDVFSRLIAWNLKKPSAMSETFVLHLQVGVYSLFHRLYGMFPCNFLAYLRSYYGGRDYSEENLKIFTKFISPMLERVRLHPLLVTASKETELSFNRWKKMEYHDVISDCASVSLDAIEGTLEGLRGRNQNLISDPRRHGSLSAQNSLQYVSLSTQSSITSASVEPGGFPNEALPSHRSSLWSPSHSHGSGPAVVHRAVSPIVHKSDPEAKLNSQLSEENVPLDFAVEAKPEELKEDESQSCRKQLMKTPSKDSKHDFEMSKEECDKSESISMSDLPRSFEKRSSDTSELLDTSLEKNILQGVEVKEDDIDKEVSELTSQNKSADGSPNDERHDTPFCSTTQNLTDEPQNVMASTSKILAKTEDEDVDEMYNSMQDGEDQAYVPAFSRYRYLSHCGPPPIIPCEIISKPKVVRSISCPANFCLASQSSSVSEADGVSESASKDVMVVATCNSSIITTTSAFVPISNNVTLSTCGTMPYKNLIPMAMDPLPSLIQSHHNSLESNYHSFDSLFKSLSPSELLDGHIQHGNDAYISQISSIPITSTKNIDWTHFGGLPPPDEIAILRKQILLLHNQLLFERHRKDIHSERIRRILGRAKKSKMQEEFVIALKEQINLLERNNEDLNYKLLCRNKLFENFKIEKEQKETELNNLIKKVNAENKQLIFTNKNLQFLLVTQKLENDQIIADSKLYQANIVSLEVELELCKQELECCRKLQKESEFLSKQLFLLQEVNNLYKDKLKQFQEPTNNPQIGMELINQASLIEINDLKMKLESTCFLLDATKSKSVELEQQLSNMKLKLKEQCHVIETLKSFHKDKMEVCLERIQAQRKMCTAKDSHMIELRKDNEILTRRLNELEKKLMNAASAEKGSSRTDSYQDKTARSSVDSQS